MSHIRYTRRQLLLLKPQDFSFLPAEIAAKPAPTPTPTPSQDLFGLTPQQRFSESMPFKGTYVQPSYEETGEDFENEIDSPPKHVADSSEIQPPNPRIPENLGNPPSWRTGAGTVGMFPGGGGGGVGWNESNWRQGAGVTLRGREQQYGHVDFQYRGPPRPDYDQWRPRVWPGSGFEQPDWQAPSSSYRIRAPYNFQGGRDFRDFRDPMHNRDFHNLARDYSREVNRDYNRDFREFNRGGWRDDRGLDMARAGTEQALPTRWSGGRAPAPPNQPMMFAADEQSAMERMLPSFLHSKVSPTTDALPDEWPDETTVTAVGVAMSALNPVTAQQIQPRTEPSWSTAGGTLAPTSWELAESSTDQHTLNDAMIAASVLQPLDPFSATGGSPPAPVTQIVATPKYTVSEPVVGSQSANVLLEELFPVPSAPTPLQTSVEAVPAAPLVAEAISTRAPEPAPTPLRSEARVETQSRQPAAQISSAPRAPAPVAAASESPAAQPAATEAQSTPPIASLEDAKKAREQWLYLDHSGKLQGPFRQAVMAAWFRGNYFHPTLKIRRAVDPEFVQFGALCKALGSETENPFLLDAEKVSLGFDSLLLPPTSVPLPRPPQTTSSASQIVQNKVLDDGKSGSASTVAPVPASAEPNNNEVEKPSTTKPAAPEQVPLEKRAPRERAPLPQPFEELEFRSTSPPPQGKGKKAANKARGGKAAARGGKQVTQQSGRQRQTSTTPDEDNDEQLAEHVAGGAPAPVHTPAPQAKAQAAAGAVTAAAFKSEPVQPPLEQRVEKPVAPAQKHKEKEKEKAEAKKDHKDKAKPAQESAVEDDSDLPPMVAAALYTKPPSPPPPAAPFSWSTTPAALASSSSAPSGNLTSSAPAAAVPTPAPTPAKSLSEIMREEAEREKALAAQRAQESANAVAGGGGVSPAASSAWAHVAAGASSNTHPSPYIPVVVVPPVLPVVAAATRPVWPAPPPVRAPAPPAPARAPAPAPPAPARAPAPTPTRAPAPTPAPTPVAMHQPARPSGPWGVSAPASAAAASTKTPYKSAATPASLGAAAPAFTTSEFPSLAPAAHERPAHTANTGSNRSQQQQQRTGPAKTAKANNAAAVARAPGPSESERENDLNAWCLHELSILGVEIDSTLLDYAHTIADEDELREYLVSIVGRMHADTFYRSYIRRRGPRPAVAAASQPTKSSVTGSGTAAAPAKASQVQPPTDAATSANAKAPEQQSKKAKTNSKVEQQEREADFQGLSESANKAQQQQSKSQSKGNKKGQVVDAQSLLGFRVASSSARYNVGDIDRPP